MTRPELFPVVELPWFEAGCPYPWPVSDRPAFSHLRLSELVTDAEVGSVAAALAKSSEVETGSAAEVLAGLVRSEELLLYGGVGVADGDRHIRPGCCCELHDWRQWLDGLRTGHSPWMGHDPAPRVEWGDSVVRVWSDGGTGPVPEAFAIDLSRERVVEQLARVEADLRGYTTRLAAWSAAAGFTEPDALADRFIYWFGSDALADRFIYWFGSVAPPAAD
jgi:hypothetical protein